MLTIEVLRGIPTSGKSTYAKKRVAEGGWTRVNNDDLRAMAHCSQSYSTTTEQVIGDARRAMIKSALNVGRNVVVDNISAFDRHWREITKIAQEVDQDVEVVEVRFPCDLKTALERNADRGHEDVAVGREAWTWMPEDVIRDWHKKVRFHGEPKREVFVASTPAEPPVYDPNLPDCIICDIDGTLAIMGDRDPYDASRCCEVDQVNRAVRETLWAHFDSYPAAHPRQPFFFYVSGREDKYLTETSLFIARVANAPTGTLIMRKSGDYRKDSVIKKEIYEAHIKGKYNVLMILDDRNQVVKMWREQGLPCWQVNPGEF